MFKRYINGYDSSATDQRITVVFYKSVTRIFTIFYKQRRLLDKELNGEHHIFILVVMIMLFGVLFFILVVGLVIFRMFKYKFKKLNRENIGLAVIAGLVLNTSDIQNVWLYILLSLDAVLLVIFIVGMVKLNQSKSAG